MLQLDVLSSFAICGAGALLGAAMLRPSLAQDAASAEAQRICRCGFGLISAGLLLPVWLGNPLPLWSQAVMAYGAVGGVVMIGWAMAALAGEPDSRISMGVTLLVLLAVLVAALPAGTRGVTVAFTLALAVASWQITWLGRRLLWRPRDLHERLIGITALVLAVSSLQRASYLLTWDGPYETHLVYMPPFLVTPFMLMYGVLPVVFVALLQNVTNARLLAQMHHRAVTDQLTGSLSRHALADSAEMLIARVRQGPGQLALIMLDLDHFKQVNDRHGHAGGDIVLRHGAQLLQSQLRPDALLVRFGGEEFVALVPVPDLPMARRVAERMRTAFEQARWTGVLPGLGPVSVSIGVTMLSADESLEQGLSRADEAMYRAKASGRNQVQVGLVAA